MKSIKPTNKIVIAKNEVIDIEVSNSLEFINILSPNKNEIKLPVFNKGNVSTLRFSGSEIGSYSVDLISQNMEIVVESSCDYPSSLTVNSEKLLLESDNKPFYMFGYECNWLGVFTQREGNDTRLIKFLDLIKNHGFNTLNINVFAYDTTWCKGKVMEDDYGPSELFPWAGTNDNPDFSKFNEDYFSSFDDVIEAIHNKKMYSHLYFKVFNKEVNWPKKGSVEERVFFDYIVKRYQGFSNIIWDFAKEAYYEEDFDYLESFYKNIDSLDSYHRLKTLHDNKGFYEDSEKIKVLDFCTTQQHYDIYTNAIWQRDKYKMPIYSSEFGYECGLAGSKDLSYMYGQSPEVFVERAWEIAFALSYPSYYYTYTAWDIIIPEHVPTGYFYWKYLKEYMEEVKYWDYSIHPELCWWRGRCLKKNNNREYLFLIEKNEHALFNIQESYESLEVEWFDMFTAKKNTVVINKKDLETIEDYSQVVLDNPFKDQWAVAKVKLL